jgi:hypothetical protein
MADVVEQGQGFDQVLVQPQRAADGPSDRSDFVRVREPRPMIVSHLAREDLHLAAQSPVCRTVHHAIPIALERPAIGVFRLRVFSAPRVRTPHGVGRQQRRFAGGDGLQARETMVGGFVHW